MTSDDREFICELEQALLALERRLGLCITIIDFNGMFHDRGAHRVFTPERQTHRKNALCLTGFGKRCIANCRYEIAARGQEARAPFLHSCYNGACEIVVPLRLDGAYAGQMFCGQWRAPGFQPPHRLAAEYSALPELPPAPKMQELCDICAIFGAGLMSRLSQEQYPERGGREARIELFIARNFNRPLTLSDLARELNVSESRASHLASQQGAGSFQERLMQRRVIAARNLLHNSDLRINEVAAAVGFADPYYFSRIFRRETGLSPREFRQRAAAPTARTAK